MRWFVIILIVGATTMGLAVGKRLGYEQGWRAGIDATIAEMDRQIARQSQGETK